MKLKYKEYDIEFRRKAILCIALGTAVGLVVYGIFLFFHIDIYGWNLGLIFAPLAAGYAETIIANRMLDENLGAISAFILFIDTTIYSFILKNPTLGFNLITAGIIGLLVGFSSGLLGVGGGVFLIAILTALLGFSMIEAIGTSSIFISLTAIGGFLSYVVSGWGVSTFPYSIGYVSLINFALIAAFSVPMASIGAKYAHKVPQKKLKIIFSILVLYMALKMLGILP